MSSRSLVSFGIALWLAASATAAASAELPRIGFISPLPESGAVPTGLREGLRELGYIEGKDILIEWRRADSVAESRVIADELVSKKVDLLVAAGTPAAHAATQATKAVPVVFASIGDPVGGGFAETLARPGGHATGVSVIAPEAYPKRLEFLHKLAPKATRVVYLMNSSNPLAGKLLAETETAARRLNMRLQTLDARNAKELDTALERLGKIGAEAVLVGGDLLFLAHERLIPAAVRKAGIPAVFPYAEYHEYDVLMSFGPSQTEAGRLAAGYVHKILKGASPSELPVHQISRVELVIDMRVAHALRIDVPSELLLRADRVIR